MCYIHHGFMPTRKRTIFALALLMCAISFDAFAISVPTLAGILSMTSSAGAIVKETHDVFRHPKLTLKKHVADIKAAAKGKKP